VNRLVPLGTLIVFMLALLGEAASAQGRSAPPTKPPTLEELDRTGQLDDFIGRLTELQALAGRLSKQKYAQCVRAFGHAAFCECLTNKTPVGASFDTYVRVVTSTKDELSYANLTKDDKALVDTTIAAREECVKITYGPQRR
jgi:hypothetical protein